MTFLCLNGRFLPSGLPLLAGSNPSFKWGEGLFETMKVHQGQIFFFEAHLQRLLAGCSVLGMDPEQLEGRELEFLILELCFRNGCRESARVRLQVFRDEGEQTNFLVEALPLPGTVNQFYQQGDAVAIFPYGRKSIDTLANLKTANYLLYALAARWARQQGLGDALVLNSENHVCDSSRANIFLVRKGELVTPPRTQGCIAGVVRGWLIGQLKEAGFPVVQQPVTEEQLLEADEVFLTNSIQDLRPVRQLGERTYQVELAREIHHRFFSTFYR